MTDDLKEALDSLRDITQWADVIARPRPDVPWQTVADETMLRAESILRKHGIDITLEYPQRVLDTREL